MAQTLYEITEDLLTFMDMADEEDMETQVFADTFNALNGAFADKCENYAKVMKNLEITATALKEEADRLTARREHIEGNIDRMKRALQSAMEVTGNEKVNTKLFTLSIQNNPQSVLIADEARIPAEFLIPQPPKVDKTAIKDFLKGLDENDGCDWAELTQTRGLRIR